MEKNALIMIDSYAGRLEKPCVVIGETPKKYRIIVKKPTSLPPKGKILYPDQSKLVPKKAIKFI